LIGLAGKQTIPQAAGLVGFTKTLARELASRNITANVVAPGFVETDMTSVLNEDVRKAALAQIPLTRFGVPKTSPRRRVSCEPIGFLHHATGPRCRWRHEHVVRLSELSS
jgi:NAD(P)-dependent dehydrogenase (short-subunit alcohol dehydrogenase family)